MKARKAKRRAKTSSKPKDLAISRRAGGRSVGVKGGVWDTRTRTTRQASIVHDV